jgi:rhodanese-related sulfurtransferase
MKKNSIGLAVLVLVLLAAALLLYPRIQGGASSTAESGVNEAGGETLSEKQATVPPLDPSQAFTEVDARQANAIIGENPDVIILDVRAKPYYDVGHIPNAINVPEKEIYGNLGKLEKGETYLLYCGGNSQSINVGNIMHKNGFKNIYRLVDGYAAWRKAGYPREK